MYPQGSVVHFTVQATDQGSGIQPPDNTYMDLGAIYIQMGSTQKIMNVPLHYDAVTHSLKGDCLLKQDAPVGKWVVQGVTVNDAARNMGQLNFGQNLSKAPTFEVDSLNGQQATTITSVRVVNETSPSLGTIIRAGDKVALMIKSSDPYGFSNYDDSSYDDYMDLPVCETSSFGEDRYSDLKYSESSDTFEAEYTIPRNATSGKWKVSGIHLLDTAGRIVSDHHVYNFMVYGMPKSPKVNMISDQSVTVTGQADPGATVKLQEGQVVIGQSTVSSNGNFSIPLKQRPSLGQTFSIYAINGAGMTSSQVKTTVSPTAPTVFPVGDNNTKITGKAEPGLTVVAQNGTTVVGTVLSSKNGTFILNLSHRPVAGEILSFRVTYNNTSSPITQVKVLDKTAPNTPQVDKITSNTNIVKGYAEKGATIYIFNGKVLIGKAITSSKGIFMTGIKKQKKNVQLTVYAKDAAGNQSGNRIVKVY